MKKPVFVSADEAVRMIPDGAAVATGGFVGSGHAEALTAALERRFVSTGGPRELTVVYAAGQGDGCQRGLNHLGHEGLVRRVIGGHWNLAPRLGALAAAGVIEAYNFPQGVLSKLFREIAAGNPGMLSKIGLGSFVDPRRGGGRINAVTTEDLVRVMEIDGVEMLFYKAFPIDVALVRGTSSDSFGNISMEHEPLIGEILPMAQAAKRGGGIVIAQVERMVADHSRNPKDIRLPGIFVDAVVVAPGELHPQTYDRQFDPDFVRQGPLDSIDLGVLEDGPRRWIAARCTQELREGDVVNLGIGIAEGIARIAWERKMLDRVVMTVEAGVIGGVPAGGLSFGSASLPMAIIDQPSMFDFYDGGGLDIAFLSMAECDQHGNVNVSRYGGRIPGSGGFINIAQTAKRLVFVGTFTANGLDAVCEDGRVVIRGEGRSRKFVKDVEQITFSAAQAARDGKEVLYVTERAVFALRGGRLELVEVAPGLDLRRDVLELMDFEPVVREVRVIAADVYGPRMHTDAQE
ncbi:MAG: acyl CoA:acetate/3-ketoacid CoA transferase [Acidobacteria bacterium]|nr:acyl CoA:acetate/3-ketoacid CoA transferase [Acidobacteriota bacterium]